ncbi:MAG: AAA family ATPase [Oceanospirillaceae bacterium]|nr:AAA family ATPase [Oceanospirillaceae bacterium]
MLCANCGFENAHDARYCAQCGTRLTAACPNCGHDVMPGARFCIQCGTALQHSTPVVDTEPEPIRYTPPHLTERILAEQAALERRADSAGERKTITVLFADMAGSTALIHGLDPEDVRRLIDPVLELMMEAVHHYEGYVAKCLGDGILALFGAPVAHEDHPQRALYAALRMQESMRRYADALRLQHGIPLQVRVGIHTGEVVVRAIRTDSLHTDYDPVGQTIHIASRMEGIATPGTIVVSEATYRLTEGYLSYKALGFTSVKGVPEPLQAYEVLGLGDLRTRLQLAASRGLAPFVGRCRELEALQRALELARAGQGQIVGVVGEPGVGKSRLFYEFKQRSQQGYRVLETFSVSHGKAFPYRPLIELLRNYLQIGPRDDERRRREIATGRVMTLDRDLEASLPYLLYLLGSTEPGSPLAQMDAGVRRQRIFDAVGQLLLRESREQPLQLIFEDLQWLDRETEAFLDDFGGRLAGHPILLLVNFRPEYRHDWGAVSEYTELRLEPLGPAEAAGLLEKLLGDHPSLAALKPRILAQTGGNPFFIEEVVQTLVEEGVLGGTAGRYRLEKAAQDLHIPTTVQGVLSARIDRLEPDEKSLLQKLAVIGKEFPLSLVQRVVDRPEVELRRGLSRLQAGEFIFERPAFPEIEYTFKHGLTQQVAYGGLLQERRRLLHERTAEAIEALFAEHLDEHLNELAWHYGHSDNDDKAVQYLQRAGEQAAHRSAYQEAIEHLEQALQRLDALPEGAERDHRELALQIDLGPILMARIGYTAPEVSTVYNRALELSRQLGDTRQRFAVLTGLRRFYNLRGDYRTAHELAELMLSQAHDSGEIDMLLEAHSGLGSTSLFQGNFAVALQHSEEVLARYDARLHGAHGYHYGLDPGVLAHTFIAWIQSFCGEPDSARSRCRTMLALAQELAHPFSLAFALGHSAELYQFLGDVEQARRQAEAAVELSTEQGLPYWLAQSSVILGWARAQSGDCDAGIEMCRSGLEAYRAGGAELACSYLLAVLAESQLRCGHLGAAREAVGEGLELVQLHGEHYYEAELHRLNAGIEMEAGRAREAEAAFLRALDIARQQGARSFELRAAIGLARLWVRQGRVSDACESLAPAYAAFTEGFDSADLRTARALLDEIGWNP